MRNITSVLLLVLAAVPLGAKWKVKEKSVEPIAITDVRKAAGRYVGIDPDYVVKLRLDDQGKLTGTVTEFGVTSTLRDLRINGAELNAFVGGLPIHGTFVKRTRNGVTSFGLMVHDTDVMIDDVSVSQLFCRKV